MAGRKTKAPKQLDRHRIIEVALDLVDKTGLDGLTIRRLADELGVQNPALYWHFRDKQEIIDRMADEMLQRSAIEASEGEPWRSWLARAARSFRAAMKSRRDGARILASADLSRSPMFARFEESLGRLVQEGFDQRDALVGIIAVYDYTLGATFEQQSDPPRTADGHPRAMMPPTVFAAAVSTLKDEDSTFEGGLTMLLDGLAARRKIT